MFKEHKKLTSPIRTRDELLKAHKVREVFFLSLYITIALALLPTSVLFVVLGANMKPDVGPNWLFFLS